MSILKKIFGSYKKETKDENIQGKFMPEFKPPIDEEFTIKFKSNGGKFLYCESIDEVYDTFKNILEENSWENKKAGVLNKHLQQKFKKLELKFTTKLNEASFFFSTCENLIANDGSLLISSNQIAEKKLKEFPDNFVVFATTSQITQNIGDGLRAIKKNNTSKIPTNITTIKHFKKATEDTNFLSYGCSSKNLYLLLLEDL